MKKTLLLIIFSLAILPDCFSQNMLIIGGEYNIYEPVFWDGVIGFNQKLFKEIIQTDLLLAFGSLTLKEEDTENEESEKFLFAVKDNLFYSWGKKYVGLRAGVSASLGLYDIPEYPKIFDFFFKIGGLVGICVFPQSFISVTLDVCPGYGMAFRLTDTLDHTFYDSGWVLPIALNMRFNFDKL
jgi:hypothetical protein